MRVGTQAGINSLIKKTREGGEGRGEKRRIPFSALCLRRSKKTSVCIAGNEPLSDTGPASILILYFPASRTVRDECYFILPNCSIVVIASQIDWDTSLAQLSHGKCEQTEAQTAHMTSSQPQESREPLLKLSFFVPYLFFRVRKFSTPLGASIESDFKCIFQDPRMEDLRDFLFLKSWNQKVLSFSLNIFFWIKHPLSMPAASFETCSRWHDW